MNTLRLFCSVMAVMLLAAAAGAVQFDFLAPGYTQQIFLQLNPGAAPGMVWTSGGNMLIKDGTNILEYSLGTTVFNGTNIHPVAVTHNIPGLFTGPTSGSAMAKGLDGNIYLPTSVGLQRFSASLTGTAQTLAGTVAGPGYGITTLNDGRIAYVAGWGANEVYVFDPSGGTNTLIYTASSLIDDIEAGSTGVIALAMQQVNAINVISNSGSLVNSFSTLSHHPDGLAFGDGAMSTALFSNNNDGSISQYVLGAGFSGTPVITDIALQTLPSGKAYGDIAGVGPDCAFYVSQFDNNGLNGSTPGTGTHWDNGVTNNMASIVRIAAIGRDGLPTCGFGTATEAVPEPASMLSMGAGLIGLLGLARRRK